MRLFSSLLFLAWIAVAMNGAEKSRMDIPVVEKPACNATNRGRLWPEGISRPKGRPVEICSMTFWKYRWQALTVNFADLSKKPGPVAAARRSSRLPEAGN